MQSSRGRIVLCLFAFIAVAFVVGPRARAVEDPQKQRDEVRRQKAAAAAKVDALKANASDVAQALDDLQDNLAAEQLALDGAREGEARALSAATEARKREAEVQARIVVIRDQLRVVAVHAYVSGRIPMDERVLSIPLDDVALARQGYLLSQASRDVDLVRSLKQAETELAAARAEADENVMLAAQKRDEAEQRVAAVEVARQAQESFLTVVKQRLEKQLAEQQSLAALDTRLSDQIAAQAAALAARVPTRPPASAGPSSSPPRTTPRSPTPPPPPTNVSLTTVHGITVATSIAPAVDRMLTAASADGVSLGGSGYRSSANQWALRVQNCPDPLNSDPFECTPPTARAGTSNHERGLAIDFTYQGQFIDTRDSPGYQWLAANAGRFGFKNLPSEPWHWSINGE